MTREQKKKRTVFAGIYRRLRGWELEVILGISLIVGFVLLGVKQLDNRTHEQVEEVRKAISIFCGGINLHGYMKKDTGTGRATWHSARQYYPNYSLYTKEGNKILSLGNDCTVIQIKEDGGNKQ